VQRQYTGSAGKVANCQIGVSLSIATPQDHVSVDFELYLPASWANDPARRAEARIPSEIGFQTKSQLALSMLRRAVAADLPRGTVLTDEAYGNAEFREGCRKLGLDFAVSVSATTRAWWSMRLGDGMGKRCPRASSLPVSPNRVPSAAIRGAKGLHGHSPHGSPSCPSSPRQMMVVNLVAVIECGSFVNGATMKTSPSTSTLPPTSACPSYNSCN
jgi:hypothetical protein